jgi:hypothetical protein
MRLSAQTQKNKLPSESYRYASMAFTSNNNKISYHIVSYGLGKILWKRKNSEQKDTNEQEFLLCTL